MKRYLAARAVLVVMAVLCALLIGPAFAGKGGGKAAARRFQAGERVTDRGRIDWNKGVLYATGLGAISNTEPNGAKAYLRARTFAKLDALRNLLMVVDHVKIDSKTVGKDFVHASDEIQAEVNGIVKGAQVVSERKIPVGNSMMVEVTIATPMYRDRGIASVFVPEIAQREEKQAEANEQRAEVDTEPQLPAPAPQVHLMRREPPAEKRQLELPSENERYTSVIIDTRGLGVERCMSPMIRRPDGSEVWGRVSANLDYVIEHGIVAYANTLEEARHNARAGENPLVIRAIGKAGGKFNSDAVIADDAADRILEANSHEGMLDKFRVIFVVDPGK